MRVSIHPELRRFVTERAGFACEYCLTHEDDLIMGAQMDHIISLKHEGPTHEINLANSCLPCNVAKGSNIATMLLPDRTLVRLFNPRTDHWDDHFYLADGLILAKTDIGKATVKILDFNAPARLDRRRLLIAAGRYPAKKNFNS